MVSLIVGALNAPVRLCCPPSPAGGFIIQIGTGPQEQIARDAVEKRFGSAVANAVACWPGTWHSIEDEPRADAAPIPTLQPITNRPVKLDLAAWGIDASTLPPLEYLYRDDEPRPHRFIVKRKNSMLDYRLMIHAEWQNCRIADKGTIMLIDCPACERVALLSYLMDQGFRFTEENAAGDESRPAA